MQGPKDPDVGDQTALYDSLNSAVGNPYHQQQQANNWGVSNASGYSAELAKQLSMQNVRPVDTRLKPRTVKQVLKDRIHWHQGEAERIARLLTKLEAVHEADFDQLRQDLTQP